jgi:hypothetical protein
MPSRDEMLAQWDKRWEQERRAGRNRYLFRNTAIQGLLPGVVGAGILMFVEPHVGEVNIGSSPWPVVAMLLFSVAGLLISLWWWRRGEKIFLERRSRHGS